MAILSAAKYAKRLESLQTLREPLETFWRNAYRYSFPIRGQKFATSNATLSAESIRASADSDNIEIYDSTAKIAIRLLASAIISGLTPANALWFGLDLRNNNDEKVKEWLEDTATTTWENIHASNFDVVAFESFVDLICSGMFGIFVKEGSEESGNPYHFEQWALHSLYCTDSTGDGVVDTVYREFRLTAEQAVNEYGEDKVSEKIRKAFATEPDEEFQFLHVIHPNPDHKRLELPIASVHIELSSQRRIVRKEKGFREMPVVVPRWFVIPESVYATGPLDDALPDIQTLNELVKITLAACDMSVSGMWGAVDDGVLNPKTISVGPRKVIMMRDKESFFPLSSGVNLPDGELKIDKLQASIKAILMSDQLQPQDGPAMTATEVHIRTQLIRQLLGPMYGRLQVEFLQPLIKRCLGIGLRAGAYNEVPEALENSVANVTYISPLAKAQKLETVGAIERFEANLFVQAQARPEVLDIYDFDGANREKAEMMGVPLKFINDADKVKQLRVERAEAQAAALEAERKAELESKVAPAAVRAGTAA